MPISPKDAAELTDDQKIFSQEIDKRISALLRRGFTGSEPVVVIDYRNDQFYKDYELAAAGLDVIEQRKAETFVLDQFRAMGWTIKPTEEGKLEFSPTQPDFGDL